jgi:hypothetical protein
VKSGPDVFADALVPKAGAKLPGGPICQIPIIAGRPRPFKRMAGRDCANGYRFAKWQGKPNSPILQ